MSVVIETLVFCDGCDQNWAGNDRALTATQIRSNRKRNGWIQRGKKDYCPQCALDIQRKNATDCLPEQPKGDSPLSPAPTKEKK